MNLRTYAWSLLVSIALTALIAAIASMRWTTGISVLLLPGILLAAIVFPQGIHSDSPVTFLILGAVFEAILLAFPVMWAFHLIRRTRKS
jgi:hypothetical protein